MNSFLTHNTLPYHQPTQMHQMMMPEPKYSPPDDYGNLQNYMGSPDFFSSPHHHHHHHQHHAHHNNHHNQQNQHGGVGVGSHQQVAASVGGGIVGVGGGGSGGGGGGGASVLGGSGGHYQGHYQQQMQAMYPSPGQTPSYYTSAAPNYGAYQMHHGGGHMPLEAQQPPAALMHNAVAQQCQGGSIPSGTGAGAGSLAAAINAVMPHDIKDDSSPSPLPCHLQPSPSSSNHMSNNPLDGSCSDDMDDNTDTDEMMMTTVNGSPIMMDDSESSDRVIYPWMKKNHMAGMRKSLLKSFQFANA